MGFRGGVALKWPISITCDNSFPNIRCDSTWLNQTRPNDSLTDLAFMYLLVPMVLVTSVLPICLMLNIHGAFTSYQSFLVKGSTLQIHIICRYSTICKCSQNFNSSCLRFNTYSNAYCTCNHSKQFFFLFLFDPHYSDSASGNQKIALPFGCIKFW